MSDLIRPVLIRNHGFKAFELPAFHADPTLFSQPLGERLLCVRWHDTRVTMIGMLGTASWSEGPEARFGTAAKSSGRLARPGIASNHTPFNDWSGGPIAYCRSDMPRAIQAAQSCPLVQQLAVHQVFLSIDKYPLLFGLESVL